MWLQIKFCIPICISFPSLKAPIMSTNDRVLSSVIPASPNEVNHRYAGLQLQTDGHKWSISFPLWGKAKVFLIYRCTSKGHKCQRYSFSHESNTNTDTNTRAFKEKTNKNKHYAYFPKINRGQPSSAYQKRRTAYLKMYKSLTHASCFKQKCCLHVESIQL